MVQIGRSGTSWPHEIPSRATDQGARNPGGLRAPVLCLLLAAVVVVLLDVHLFAVGVGLVLGVSDLRLDPRLPPLQVAVVPVQFHFGPTPLAVARDVLLPGVLSVPLPQGDFDGAVLRLIVVALIAVLSLVVAVVILLVGEAAVLHLDLDVTVAVRHVLDRDRGLVVLFTMVAAAP